MSDRASILAERARLRATYGSLFDEVSEILFRHDPMAINYETNTDEYEPEVATILPLLAAVTSAEDVRVVVHREFIRWFGEDVGDEARYENPAREIWVALLRLRGG